MGDCVLSPAVADCVLSPAVDHAGVSRWTSGWQIPFAELLGGEPLVPKGTGHGRKGQPPIWSSQAAIKGGKEFCCIPKLLLKGMIIHIYSAILHKWFL